MGRWEPGSVEPSAFGIRVTFAVDSARGQDPVSSISCRTMDRRWRQLFGSILRSGTVHPSNPGAVSHFIFERIIFSSAALIGVNLGGSTLAASVVISSS